jgi:transcriptional regulator with XRE-family HTH domain
MRRNETVEVFRTRLVEVIEGSGLSRSEFARRIGADRSTLSQLLAADGTRLPRAETIAAIAGVAQVSVDWLLGLSGKGQLGTDVLNEAVAIEPGAASPADERLKRWHTEAAGYKIRYVPTTLPDLLKTEEVIRYEYVQHDTLEPQGRIEYAEARLAYSRRPETDIEACSSYQSLAQFARGEGQWQDLAFDTRIAQIQSMIRLLDELYPTFRWFLFDIRKNYSVPLTIFGPQRAAIYIGDMYLVSTSQEHIRVLTGHFDNLIRAAVMQPPEVIEYLKRLLGEATVDERANRKTPMSA